MKNQKETRDELFLYADRFDYHAGDRVTVFASATVTDSARLQLVKPSASGDRDGVDFTYEVVSGVEQKVDVGFQETLPGSFGIVAGVVSPSLTECTIAAYIWPTRVEGDEQTILSWQPDCGTRLDLAKDASGRMTARVHDRDGNVQYARIDEPLSDRQWYLVAAIFRPNGQLIVRQVPVQSSDPRDTPREANVGGDPRPTTASGKGQVVIAASELVNSPDGSARTTTAFDGKIEAPALFSRELTLQELAAIDPTDDAWVGGAFAAWRFDSDFDTAQFRSITPGQPGGTLYQAPARGMTGRNWTGLHLDFRYAPNEYGAIHFHSDDLEDAAWAASAQLMLPEDLPTGIYCVLVKTSTAEDHVPIFVSPKPGERSADVLFLAPTFSYLAYANSRLAEELDFTSGALTDLVMKMSGRDQQIYSHREFGMSLYDHHVDGSGNCYSTSLRPIPNMRWDYRSALQDAPRHFAADLIWPSWFSHHDIAFDVLTDHALHDHGSNVLSGYKIVITGSHPEYWSADMLDAVEEYLADGGSFAYTGGNGFYWVTSASKERSHLLEVRRGQQGIRTWEGEPGEATSTQSMEPGGLWRLRGRAPNKLVGVGMAAQGWDTATPGFEKTEHANNERVADLFEGIDEKIIGDFGLILGGAAGDEIDRADERLGTPRHALIIARSQPHSRYYLAASEEVPTPTPNINGTNNPNVRADLTFFETGNGGFVVSTSAITWLGSMAYRHFDNNVSRFMRNVVRKAIDTGTESRIP